MKKRFETIFKSKKKTISWRIVEGKEPYRGGQPAIMVCEIPPLAEPVLCPGGAKSKPPFEMGVSDLEIGWIVFSAGLKKAFPDGSGDAGNIASARKLKSNKSKSAEIQLKLTVQVQYTGCFNRECLNF